MLYSYIHIYNANLSGNIAIMTHSNGRTNTPPYNDISLTLYSRKGWCWLYVRGELETGTDGYTLTQLLLTIAALISHLDWAAQPWVTEGPKLSVCHWLSRRHLVPLWLQLQLTQAVCVLVIFLFDVHLLPLFFRLFTQVHLLIDCSVESQYVTFEWSGSNSEVLVYFIKKSTFVGYSM